MPDESNNFKTPARGIVARKRFGQNFLQDGQIITHIIQEFAPNPADLCVEIGPGLGALTLPLLKKIHKLKVIELDRDIIPVLAAKAQGLGDLEIYQGDILEFDLHTLQSSQQKFRVIGNLPYNISTPLIFHLLAQLDVIKDMHFMLQQEVVDRMAAPPKSKTYGRLSVMIQYYCHVQDLFSIPPQAFSPPPKVYSKVVRLIPYVEKPFVAKNEDLFAEIVKKAFGQRRKTIRNSLKETVSAEVFDAVNLSPTLRAEDLSVEDYVRLANAMA